MRMPFYPKEVDFWRINGGFEDIKFTYLKITGLILQ
jgi:hypothetical protein